MAKMSKITQLFHFHGLTDMPSIRRTTRDWLQLSFESILEASYSPISTHINLHLPIFAHNHCPKYMSQKITYHKIT